MKNLLCLTGILLITIATKGQDCNLTDNAQRYFARANAAIKEAKNEADYLNAVEEFKKALQYAPDCPDIYYNIGFCYDISANSGILKKDVKSCSQAVTYFKKYLELKPNAQNKQTVQNRIYELDYKYDKLNDLSKSFNSGKNRKRTGVTLLCIGIPCAAVGGGLVSNTGTEVLGGAMMLAGTVSTIASIPIMISGHRKMSKAKRLYNESMKNERRSFSEVKIGFTGNGVGLTFSF